MQKHAPFFTAIGLGLVGCSGAPDASQSSTQSETAATVAAATVCSPAEQEAAIARALTQPIIPPYQYAGLNLAGGASGTLTYEEATKTLCQGDDAGPSNDAEAVTWGPNQEIYAEYDVTTRKITMIILGAGYTGKLDFTSRPTSVSDPASPNPFGQHTYSVGIGTPILRDGLPWELDWTNLDGQSTELFDALMFTFAPAEGGEQTNCRGARKCLARVDGVSGRGSFGARPIHAYFDVPDAKTQPAASTPDALFTFL
jgi:hypothetical protein